MLKLNVITSQYPSSFAPQRGTFVRALVNEFSQCGATVTVVAPEPYKPLWKRQTLETSISSAEHNGVITKTPTFLSCSDHRLPWGVTTFGWTVYSFARAALRMRTKKDSQPDVNYGHFLYPSGYAALFLRRKYNTPAVVALGESRLAYYETLLGPERIRKDLSQFSGILAVSKSNKDYCVEHMGVPQERILVIPNAIDSTHFYPRDRGAMRRRLGLPSEQTIVIFVGHFIERKGPMRLLAALRSLPDVKAVFLGQGPQRPEGPQVLYADAVSHDKVPEWLSSADLFVLPTLAEGSCNAILEAMACGLPVVSSNRPFNAEIVNDRVGRLVDPEDSAKLAAVIQDLLQDPVKLRTLGGAAAKRAAEFPLSHRAKIILDWLAGIVEEEASR